MKKLHGIFVGILQGQRVRLGSEGNITVTKDITDAYITGG